MTRRGDVVSAEVQQSYSNSLIQALFGPLMQFGVYIRPLFSLCVF